VISGVLSTQARLRVAGQAVTREEGADASGENPAGSVLTAQNRRRGPAEAGAEEDSGLCSRTVDILVVTEGLPSGRVYSQSKRQSSK
jgi:hypothetical protein